MRFSVLEKNLSKQIEQSIRDVTPGVMVRAYQNGRMVCDISVGQTYAYYDLASLTKVIFGTQAMIWGFEKGLWTLESRVQGFLSWFPSAETRVQDLLTHCSGLDWWQPFYQKISLDRSLAEKREELRILLSEQKLKPTDCSVYSDLGYLVLGFIMEKVFEKPMLEIWEEIKGLFFPGTTLEFHPENRTDHRPSLFAPTEECPWRHRLLQGEVHDENCWALGGVSTHAGLFGSIDDVAWFGLNLRSQLLGIAKYHIRQKTTQLFCRRARPPGGGDWALGYMMPTPGSASCGQYFSLNSVGHTGFTGTSFWYDPHMDLVVVILSNRLVYGRENKAFAKFRPEIHNWIVEGYRKSSI